MRRLNRKPPSTNWYEYGHLVAILFIAHAFPFSSTAAQEILPGFNVPLKPASGSEFEWFVASVKHHRQKEVVRILAPPDKNFSTFSILTSVPIAGYPNSPEPALAHATRKHSQFEAIYGTWSHPNWVEEFFYHFPEDADVTRMNEKHASLNKYFRTLAIRPFYGRVNRVEGERPKAPEERQVPQATVSGLSKQGPWIFSGVNAETFFSKRESFVLWQLIGELRPIDERKLLEELFQAARREEEIDELQGFIKIRESRGDAATEWQQQRLLELQNEVRANFSFKELGRVAHGKGIRVTEIIYTTNPEEAVRMDQTAILLEVYQKP